MSLTSKSRGRRWNWIY